MADDQGSSNRSEEDSSKSGLWAGLRAMLFGGDKEPSLREQIEEVIDEAGLEKALEDRPDLKYITDVAPDNIDVLKEKFGIRVFATPKKMGAQTAEANINAGLAAARQIVAYFADGCTKFQVNK